MQKKVLRSVEVKLKPWGREIWFAWTPQYAGKILEIEKGHRFSLQYHKKKSETQLLIEGKLEFTMGKGPQKLETWIVHPGEKIDILPGVIHRAKALEKSIIFEVSSPELDDVVKLADDYGRSGSGNDPALDAKLARSKKGRTK